MKRFFLVFVLILNANAYLHAQNQDAPLTADVKLKVVDGLSAALKKNYVFVDTAAKMGAYIKSKLKKGDYNSIDKPVDFAITLNTDLHAVYNDLHLSVFYNPPFEMSLLDTSKADAAKMEQQDFNAAKRDNFAFSKLEVLSNNIGYIRFTRFYSVSDESKATVNSAFSFLKNTNALIIDLRYNSGGDPEMVKYVCSYFFKEKTHINDLYERRINKTTAYWTEPLNYSNTFSAVPVYILVSKGTFSGAEEFAYDLQNQHRATIIGETTGGGAHPVEPEPLGNGFVGNIPFARAINPVSKKNWEAVGVMPDIKVKADSALDYATLSYNDYQINNSKDSSTIKAAKWARNFLNAKFHPATVNQATLMTYKGDYNGVVLSLEGGNLYITWGGSRKDRLTPISQTAFTNQDRLIEFNKNADGKVDETVVTLDNGYIARFKRKQ
ncbi:MAG: Peptidase family [Mucilaginibacter sp.]|nr:Peptidase family [Mucilaginibacter sp.]